MTRSPSTVTVAALSMLMIAVGALIAGCASPQHGPARAGAASHKATATPTPTPARVTASSCLIGTWQVVKDDNNAAVPSLVSGSELRQFSPDGIYTVTDSDATFNFIEYTGVWNATITWDYTVHGQQLAFTFVSQQGSVSASDGAVVTPIFGSPSALSFGCSGNSLTLQGNGYNEQLTRT